MVAVLVLAASHGAVADSYMVKMRDGTELFTSVECVAGDVCVCVCVCVCVHEGNWAQHRRRQKKHTARLQVRWQPATLHLCHPHAPCQWQ